MGFTVANLFRGKCGLFLSHNWGYVVANHFCDGKASNLQRKKSEFAECFKFASTKKSWIPKPNSGPQPELKEEHKLKVKENREPDGIPRRLIVFAFRSTYFTVFLGPNSQSETLLFSGTLHKVSRRSVIGIGCL